MLLCFLADEDINKISFLELEGSDLNEMGLKIGQQKAVMRIIKVLKSPSKISWFIIFLFINVLNQGIY